MKLFLCSNFVSVGSLINDKIDNKKIALVPTAASRDGSTDYVDKTKNLLEGLGATITEIDISKAEYPAIEAVFEEADILFFTGGNTFFLMDQLRITGTDELVKKEVAKGKLLIGESAGAIVCAPNIKYVEQMDEKPKDYSQKDDAGLGLIDLYVIPHYLQEPYKKATENIMVEYSDRNLYPINNEQGIMIDGESTKLITKS